MPFYKTRKFWVITYTIALAWSGFFYFFTFPQGVGLTKTIQYVADASGGGLFISIGKLAGETGIILSFSAYLLFVIFLIYRTLKSNIVNPIFPIVFVINFLLGSLIVFGAIASLS